jgi:hypothetical protein
VAATGLAFLKWTALPVVFVILGVYVLGFRSAADFRRRCRPVLLCAAVFVLLFGVLWEDGVRFVLGLADQEARFRPDGLSLVAYMPRLVEKLLPLELMAIGALCVRWRRGGDTALVPFVLGATIILLNYPTLAYDYNVPSLLPLLPIVMYWAASAQVTPHTGRVATYGFSLFLLLASFSMEVFRKESLVLSAYAVASIGMLLLAGRSGISGRGRASHGLAETRLRHEVS